MWHKLCWIFHPWCPMHQDPLLVFRQFPTTVKVPRVIMAPPVLIWMGSASSAVVPLVTPDQRAQVTYFEHIEAETNWQCFTDDIFKRTFFNENVWNSINNSLKFVPKGPINNIPALVQRMAWRRPGDKPLSEPMMVSLPTHMCVTRPQWVTSLAPGRYGSDFLNCVNFMSTPREITLLWMQQNTFDEKSTLGLVMAWCRQATSHYLNQFFFFLTYPLAFIWWQFNERYLSHRSLILAWNYILKFYPNLPGANELTWIFFHFSFPLFLWQLSQWWQLHIDINRIQMPLSGAFWGRQMSR